MSSAFPHKPCQCLLLQLKSIQYPGCEIMLLTNIHRVLIPYATMVLSAFRTIFHLLPKNPCAYSMQMKKWRRPGKNLPRLTANEWRVRNQTQTVISRAWAWTNRAVSEELATAQSWIFSGGKTSKHINSHLYNHPMGEPTFQSLQGLSAGLKGFGGESAFWTVNTHLSARGH